MKKKFYAITLLSLLLITICSYSFAANNMMDSAKNAVMNVGNSIGNAATKTKDALVNGAQDLTNGAANLGNDAMNTARDMGNDTMNAVDGAGTTLGGGNSDYTATRTATTDSGLFGMSDTAWTWLILGIATAAIVALVWYYGAQYEHRNYNND